MPDVGAAADFPACVQDLRGAREGRSDVGVGAGEERRGVGRVARGPAGEMLVFRPDLHGPTNQSD